MVMGKSMMSLPVASTRISDAHVTVLKEYHTYFGQVFSNCHDTTQFYTKEDGYVRYSSIFGAICTAPPLCPRGPAIRGAAIHYFNR
jgi:hypothetical protein